MTVAGRVLRFIVGIFNGLTKEARKLLPVAIAIGNAVKQAIDNPTSVSGSIVQFLLDAVKQAIPGKADDLIIDGAFEKLKEKLPILLLDMRLINSIADIEDPEERLKAVLAELKFSSDTQYNLFIHDFVILVTNIIADGKITWEEILMIQEAVYKHPEILEK